MKNFNLSSIIGPLVLMSQAFSVSCESFAGEEGKVPLLLSFSEESKVETKSASGVSVMDTNDFILTVLDSDGKTVYYGKYGAAPEQIMVSPGSYSVSVVSSEESLPQFDMPIFGDGKIVLVKSGEPAFVTLDCRQVNAGIKLSISPDFPVKYKDCVLFLKSADGKKVMYSYMEKRTVYFNPGTVSLIMVENEKETLLFKKLLSAQEMVNVNVYVSPDYMAQNGMSIAVDTSRIWLNDTYVIGALDGRGSLPENAISVPEAGNFIGAVNVWVRGYVVGGDLSSSNASFAAPFSSRTNLLIASKSSVSTRSSCMSVQLSKGEVRDALNLVDNPSVIGREVFLRGTIVESYYGLVGLQNLSEYVVR